MNLIKSIHETAMEFSTLAGISKAKGLKSDSMEAYRLAFELEKKAAFKTKITDSDKLSRLILLRSAAALAMKAGEKEEAQKLIKIAISENPPEWLKNEILEIEELIQAKNHKKYQILSISGIIIHADAPGKEIRIESNDDAWTVLVLNNDLDEIVANFWKKQVDILAHQTPFGVLVLEKIKMAA